MSKFEEGVSGSLVRLDGKLARAARSAASAKKLVEKGRQSQIASIDLMYEKLRESQEGRRLKAEEAERLKETVTGLQTRVDSLVRERSVLQARVETLTQTSAKAKQIERQLSQTE